MPPTIVNITLLVIAVTLWKDTLTNLGVLLECTLVEGSVAMRTLLQIIVTNRLAATNIIIGRRNDYHCRLCYCHRWHCLRIAATSRNIVDRHAAAMAELDRTRSLTTVFPGH
jgi:hypothetical protein